MSPYLDARAAAEGLPYGLPMFGGGMWVGGGGGLDIALPIIRLAGDAEITCD